MKIKMLTTKCGPITSENWSEGQVRDVSVEEAKTLVNANLAIALEPFSIEKAVVKPVEQAKVQPSEKAVVVPEEVKEPVINIPPPTWTKGAKK